MKPLKNDSNIIKPQPGAMASRELADIGTSYRYTTSRRRIKRSQEMK
jgi:hypothetical protein